MVAPRFFAASSSSRIKIPAPSPTMKPSRPLSNGRLARAGSSLRVERARIAANPPTPIGVMAASEPPAIITSASLRLMISKASPIACADAEHAVQVAEFGPLAPKRMETWPAARLMMAAGMKNGEMRRGPPSSSALGSRSSVGTPPIPEAMNTPVRVAISALTFRFASSIANCDAAMASWMKMSIFLTSFFSMNWSGSKFFTSPAMRAENWAASNRVIGPMPLCPAQSACQFASVPIPSGDTRPTPVTTTRLLKPPPAYFFLLWDSMYSTASLTRVIFSASSSGISIPNSSSNAITSSTVSSESAPRSSTNDASGVTSSSSTPSCSTMMAFTFSATAIPCLLGVHPAVHGQNVSCNIRRLVRGKKAHGVCHVRGAAQPPQRNLRRPVPTRTVRQGPSHVGLDEPGRHHVHCDAARGDFARDRLTEPDQARLGRGVVGLAGVAALPHHGADGHEAASTLLDHGLQGRLAQRERRRQIRRQHGVPVVALH